MIVGIPCSIDSSSIRTAIEAVLSAVQKRKPKDYARLRERVRGIQWLPVEEECLTVGRWHRVLYEKTVKWPTDPEQISGIVYLSMSLSNDPEWKRVAVVAHELGHACTTKRDRHRRRLRDEAWESELCADYYAYRWGFGRETRRSMACRPATYHHFTNSYGGGPGFKFEFMGRRYRITRNFVCREVKS